MSDSRVYSKQDLLDLVVVLPEFESTEDDVNVCDISRLALILFRENKRDDRYKAKQVRQALRDLEEYGEFRYREDLCPTCSGVGAVGVDDGSNPITCSTCLGRCYV